MEKFANEIQIKLAEAQEMEKTANIRIAQLNRELQVLDEQIRTIEERDFQSELALLPELDAKIQKEIEDNIWNPEETDENYNDPYKYPNHPVVLANAHHGHGHH
jgi:hypothetical protein